MRHVSEAALPQYGCSGTLVSFPGVFVMTLEAVSDRAEAVSSDDGSLMRASCAAMPRCTSSEGLDQARQVRYCLACCDANAALEASLFWNDGEISVAHVRHFLVFFPVVCSGPLACGLGSKEKFQSKDVFQLACGSINAPSQVGMRKAAAAALLCPFKTNGYATALAELLTHFESHGAVVAAACVTKDVSEEFLLHFLGWSGILAHTLLFLVVPSSTTHTDCENAELSACLHFFGTEWSDPLDGPECRRTCLQGYW